MTNPFTSPTTPETSAFTTHEDVDGPDETDDLYAGIESPLASPFHGAGTDFLDIGEPTITVSESSDASSFVLEPPSRVPSGVDDWAFLNDALLTETTRKKE